MSYRKRGGRREAKLRKGCLIDLTKMDSIDLSKYTPIKPYESKAEDPELLDALYKESIDRGSIYETFKHLDYHKCLSDCSSSESLGMSDGDFGINEETARYKYNSKKRKVKEESYAVKQNRH